MPNLTNSLRRLYKATYAPIKPDPRTAPVLTTRGVEKSVYVGSLALRASELPALRAYVEREAGGSALVAALEAIAKVVTDGSPAAPIRVAADLAKVDAQALIALGRALQPFQGVTFPLARVRSRAVET